MLFLLFLAIATAVPVQIAPKSAHAPKSTNNAALSDLLQNATSGAFDPLNFLKLAKADPEAINAILVVLEELIGANRKELKGFQTETRNAEAALVTAKATQTSKVSDLGTKKQRVIDAQTEKDRAESNRNTAKSTWDQKKEELTKQTPELNKVWETLKSVKKMIAGLQSGSGGGYEYMGCYHPSGWARPYGDVANSFAGAIDCRNKCAKGGYAFWGLECPRSTIHCQCNNNSTGSKIDDSKCKGPGVGHCVGPFEATEGSTTYYFGGYGIASSYRAN